MSVDVQKLEAKLQELTGERDAVGSTKTLEDAAAIATSFAEVARRDEVAGLILNAHAYGEPLQRVLNAYTASDSGLTFEEWLVETAQSQGFELNEKGQGRQAQGARCRDRIGNGQLPQGLGRSGEGRDRGQGQGARGVVQW